jgi:hypothetical protein
MDAIASGTCMLISQCKAVTASGLLKPRSGPYGQRHDTHSVKTSLSLDFFYLPSALFGTDVCFSGRRVEAYFLSLPIWPLLYPGVPCSVNSRSIYASLARGAFEMVPYMQQNIYRRCSLVLAARSGHSFAVRAIVTLYQHS